MKEKEAKQFAQDHRLVSVRTSNTGHLAPVPTHLIERVQYYMVTKYVCCGIIKYTTA